MELVSAHLKCLVCASPMNEMFRQGTFHYFRCLKCRHVTTVPYPTQIQIEEHYRQAFKQGNYSEVRKHEEVYKSAMEALVHKLQQYLKSQNSSLKNLSLLDVGCFTGDFLAKVQRFGAQVAGVELQEEATDIANKKLGPGTVINADVIHDALPWLDAQFDVVTVLGLIEHVTNPALLLKRVHTFLKPGGVLMIQTPDSNTLAARLMRKMWPPYTPLEHIHLFSYKSLKMLLERSGYNPTLREAHVKKLTPLYVYGILRTFGPRLRRAITPLYIITPSIIRNLRLPFYIGEMIVFAKKR